MRKVSRRNFLGKLLCAVSGIGLLPKVSFGKENPFKSPIEEILKTPKGKRVDISSFGSNVAKALEIPKGEPNPGRTDIDGPNQLELLKSITWDYASDDIDPITHIDGKPVKLFMWEIVSGHHITQDFKIYEITEEKREFPVMRIHPYCIMKCNVKERRIDYMNAIRVAGDGSVWNYWDYDVERNENGEPVIYRLDFIHNLVVNLLDPQGNVITTLKGK